MRAQWVCSRERRTALYKWSSINQSKTSAPYDLNRKHNLNYNASYRHACRKLSANTVRRCFISDFRYENQTCHTDERPVLQAKSIQNLASRTCSVVKRKHFENNSVDQCLTYHNYFQTLLFSMYLLPCDVFIVVPKHQKRKKREGDSALLTSNTQ